MIDHDRSIRLSAASLTEVLSGAQAGELDAHLHACPTCRRDHSRLADDHRRLRLLLAPQPVAIGIRGAVLAEAASTHGSRSWPLLLVAALLGLVLVGLAVLAGGPRDRDELADFRGTWTTTNCATWVVSETGLVDCGRWGDGSALTMEVGRGAMPWVTLTGASAPGCAGTLRLDPAPSLDRPGTFALVALSDTDCGDIKAGPDRELQLYLEPDGDIWLDEDGDAWGLFWEQVPGTS